VFVSLPLCQQKISITVFSLPFKILSRHECKDVSGIQIASERGEIYVLKSNGAVMSLDPNVHGETIKFGMFSQDSINELDKDADETEGKTTDQVESKQKKASFSFRINRRDQIVYVWQKTNTFIWVRPMLVVQYTMTLPPFQQLLLSEFL
jgi:hypothetical protein